MIMLIMMIMIMIMIMIGKRIIVLETLIEIMIEMDSNGRHWRYLSTFMKMFLVHHVDNLRKTNVR